MTRTRAKTKAPSGDIAPLQLVTPGRDALQARIEAWRRDAATPLGLIIAVIENMDGLAHGFGLDAAATALNRLCDAARETAPEGALVARLSCAKVGVLFAWPDEAAETACLNRLAGTLSTAMTPTAYGDVRLMTHAGAAWAASPDGDEPRDLMGEAFNALESARAHGPGAARLYRPEPGGPEDLSGAVRLAMSALAEDRLSMALQPVVDSQAPGRVMFREGLARITRPDGTALAANAFFPALERLGLVSMFDRRMFALALAELDRDPALRLSLNVSQSGVGCPEWMAMFEAAAAETPMLLERLILELTEEAAMAHPAVAGPFLDKLRGHGVGLALDDFGAGRTSFSQLRAFRMDFVKIDGGFIRDLDRNPDHRLLVATLVGIARGFEMTTVGEFVETAREARALREIGVDGLQGYLYGRPALSPGAREAGNVRALAVS